jgi:hypothetical protein
MWDVRARWSDQLPAVSVVGSHGQPSPSRTLGHPRRRVFLDRRVARQGIARAAKKENAESHLLIEVLRQLTKPITEIFARILGPHDQPVGVGVVLQIGADPVLPADSLP